LIDFLQGLEKFRAKMMAGNYRDFLAGAGEIGNQIISDLFVKNFLTTGQGQMFITISDNY
jgi:hypothetical protein